MKRKTGVRWELLVEIIDIKCLINGLLKKIKVLFIQCKRSWFLPVFKRVANSSGLFSSSRKIEVNYSNFYLCHKGKTDTQISLPRAIYKKYRFPRYPSLVPLTRITISNSLPHTTKEKEVNPIFHKRETETKKSPSHLL